MRDQHGTVTHYGGSALLRPGDIIDFEGGEKIVVRVNQSRAVLTNLTKRNVSFTDGRTGAKVGFVSVGTEIISIAPDSLLPIKRRLGEAGLEHWQTHREVPA